MLSYLPMQGVFRGFDCSSLAAHPLGRVSVIFGRNGTGKTSLSESLRRSYLGRTDAPKVHPPFKDQERIAVFNRFYVEENLAPFVDGDSTAPALAIGSQNIQLKSQESFLVKHIHSRVAHEQRLETKLSNVKTLRDIAADAKQAVIDKLEDVHPRYSRISYRNTERFRSRIEHLGFIPSQASEAQLFADAQLTEVATEPPPPLKPKSCPVDFTEVPRLLEAIGEREDEAVITLTRHQIEWLRQGLDSLGDHDSGCVETKCPFCGRSMDDGLVQAIRATLQTPGIKLEEQLSSIRMELIDYQNYLEDLYTQVESLRLPHPAHNAQLDSPRKELLQDLSKWIDWLRSAIKSTNIGDRPPAPTAFPLDSIPETLDTTSFNAVIATYRQAISDTAQTRELALTELENRVLLPFSTENSSMVDCRAKIRRSLQATRRSIKTAKIELARVRDSMTDTAAAAERMTRDLHGGLGMFGFSIQPNDDRTAYAIVRPGGIPAENLSEGERHIVSLLYFLHSLNAIEYESRDVIVYIDDPGTSLDSENIHAILEFIRASSKQWEQLIISTHSIYTFKQAQKIWGAAGFEEAESDPSDQKEQRASGAEQVESLPTTFFETSYAGKGEGGRPLWELATVSPALTKFSSDYEYAYWMTVSAAAGDIQPELLPGVANTARRALEGLLSFKCPGVTNVRNALDEVWSHVDQHGNFSALKVAAMAFMNRASHKADSPGGSNLWSGTRKEDFVQATAVLAIIDEQHFERLLRSYEWLSHEKRQEYKNIPRPFISLMQQARQRPDFDADSVVRKKVGM